MRSILHIFHCNESLQAYICATGDVWQPLLASSQLRSVSISISMKASLFYKRSGCKCGELDVLLVNGHSLKLMVNLFSCVPRCDSQSEAQWRVSCLYMKLIGQNSQGNVSLTVCHWPLLLSPQRMSSLCVLTISRRCLSSRAHKIRAHAH